MHKMTSDSTPSAPPANNRTSSGGYKTAEGTLYVSKPFRSKTTKKVRALITFAPRKSHFDTSNESSGANEFRGFFTLFWISIFIFTVRTYIRSIETHGHALNLNFAARFSEDAITLAISDFFVVLTTGLCVPFAKAVSKGWIRYQYTGMVLQHVLQTTLLFSAIVWTFNRQWPWVQSGYLTLHSIVMVMKMHSYMAVNGNLQVVLEQTKQLTATLHKVATSTSGSFEKAVAEAISHKASLVPSDDGSDKSYSSEELSGTPEPENEASGETRSAYVDLDTANALKQRLSVVADPTTVVSDTVSSSSEGLRKRALAGAAEEHAADTNEQEDDHNDSENDPVRLLADHPDHQVSDLAKDIIELQGELRSTGPYPVQYPNNITLKNFAVYQLIPSLVYQLEYPRTEKIRPGYVLEKTVATMGTFALLYTVTESFILPLTPTRDQSFLRSLLDLSLPFMIAYLLLFFIIFECICNGFAELSYFADRQFYEDWWNSTSWDEFARKWNRPVHGFLLHHVYASTISHWRVSRTTAMFLTFLLSACVHELVMVIVTKKFRMYLFWLQLIQLPLIAMSKLPVIRQNQTLGNIVFWLGLYAGFPLLCVAYVAY